MFAMGAATPVLAEKIREIQVPTPLAGVDPNIIKQIEDICPQHVTFCSTYGEIAPPSPPNAYQFVGNYNEVMRIDSAGNVSIGTNSLYGNLYNGTKQFVPGTEKQVSVKMVPGPDGELYINVNGQWKRVLTA